MAIIGEILKRTNFENLVDFDLKAGWDVVSGKIVCNGNNDILQYKYTSMLDKFTWKIKTNSSALNIQFFGIRSANNIRTTLSLENGKAKWAFAYNSTTGISAQTIAIDQGDILEYVFTKDEWNYTFTVNNITKGTSSSVATSSITLTAHKLRLWSSSPLEITSLEKTSNQEFAPNNLLLGDSISYGSSATTSANRWGQLAGFQIEGSTGDTSVEGLELLYEVTNIIKPKRVIYAFATNDLNIEVWKTNLMDTKARLEQRNIVFIPITPYANSTRDLSAFQAFIQGNFTKYFDVFSITKQSGNTNMKTEYNSGDGIHPNNLGHHDISQYVLSSPYYNFIPIVPQDDVGIFAMILDKWYSNY